MTEIDRLQEQAVVVITNNSYTEKISVPTGNRPGLSALSDRQTLLVNLRSQSMEGW